MDLQIQINLANKYMQIKIASKCYYKTEAIPKRLKWLNIKCFLRERESGKASLENASPQNVAKQDQLN